MEEALDRTCTSLFVINTLENVLYQKPVSEKCLKSSGINYTIVQASSLKTALPKGALKVCRENTLYNEEVLRDLVTDICFSSLIEPKCSNKVLKLTKVDTRK